jgi:hypothetical protein
MMRNFWLNLLLVPIVGLFALTAISRSAEEVIKLADCSSKTCEPQCITNNAPCATVACNHCTCKHQSGIKECWH